MGATMRDMDGAYLYIKKLNWRAARPVVVVGCWHSYHGTLWTAPACVCKSRGGAACTVGIADHA